MSRFEQEWALVPTAARVIAVLAPLSLVALLAFLLLVAPLSGGEMAPPNVWGLFVFASLVAGVPMAVFVLLLGYVWADAGRRGMNPLGWTLLAIFVPGAVGLILYFLLPVLPDPGHQGSRLLLVVRGPGQTGLPAVPPAGAARLEPLRPLRCCPRGGHGDTDGGVAASLSGGGDAPVALPSAYAGFAAGLMFWFTWNRFPGSYRALISASRA
jgi:hypothetical protein